MKIADQNTKAVDLIKEALKKAKEYEKYHCFLSINEENALKKAAEIDKKIAKGEKVGRLAGVPYALKANFSSHEGETTAAALILEGYTAPITSTAVERLENEGAIMLGRVNLDAFAHGSSTENSYYGLTHNSKDFERVAGGSSGGSAVAVALDIVQFATGTDTGGSIRQPAAFNGIYGLKPTFGAVSRYGVVAMASSTDTIGCFARTPDDVDLVMSVMAGLDDKDSTTLEDFWQKDKLPDSSKYRIGVIKDFLSDGVDADIKAATLEHIQILKEKGHEVVEVEMPTLKYALAIYYIVQPAEVASNLSRHDGIRYGFRSEKSSSLDELYGNTRDEGFMTENKRRILIGNFVLSSGFFDAYYLKAQKARTLLINEFEKTFKDVDILLCPTTPMPAFKIGEKTDDPLSMYMEDLMTVPASIAGLPGLSIPAGETKDGLSIGLQLIGPRRSDRNLIALAKEIA